MNVAVLVVGDVGRSPRMQYHCASLGGADWVNHVYLVGLEGSKCIAEVEENKEKITKELIKPPVTQKLSRRLLLLYAPVKIVQQVLQLLYILLFKVPKLDVVLVQNPPCIPVFAVLFFVRMVRRTNVIIDWHNLGFTILEMSTENRVVIGFARWYEKWFGYHIGDAHLTVTQALKQWLHGEFALPLNTISVQYDKPPTMFHKRNLEEQHRFFERVGDVLSDGRGNIFTTKSGTTVENNPQRPFIVVSSTSWTPDEDFNILLSALVQLEKKLSQPVLCCVTGKGPQKEMFLRKIEELEMKYVTIKTVWLEPEDYPVLLGSADLGVCLHTSSSNLDLPMKVVDMFGSGLPVCAINYDCIGELVRNEENGLIFRDELELALQLETLLIREPEKLSRLTNGVHKFNQARWEPHWQSQTMPVFRGLKTPRRRGGLLLLLLLLSLVLMMVSLPLLNQLKNSL